MASQQVLFAETIVGMKKAFKRKAHESDSDSEIENHGNRGNKLKKRARFARQGQLAPTQGPSAYKESVGYPGVRRAIIHRNPPLLDEDGYEIDSGDDDDSVEEAELAAAQLNPYVNIRLEHVLAPLTAPTDLPTHSTLSRPFLSTNLTDLVSQSSNLMRTENRSLWRIKHLWTSLCGDGTWMPCELMVGSDDLDLYRDDHVARHHLSLAKATGAGALSPATLNGKKIRGEMVDGTNNAAANTSSRQERPEEVHGDCDVSITDAGRADNDDGKLKRETTAAAKENDTERSPETLQQNQSGDQPGDSRGGGVEAENKPTNGYVVGTGEKHENSQVQDRPGYAVMQGAEATTEPERPGDKPPSVTSEALEQAFIHPMFLMPAGAKPDRDLGLPGHEAEDIRRLLALYVQKQEEVCRGASKLHHGLLKAERLRKEVLHWAKAEAHCGANRDMSDGEDWYDKEEWGLTEDLKKGQDEEEEDTTTTGKKTRTRR